MTDKPRKWEPARRQSRRVLSSLGLRSSPGQQSPSAENRATRPHTAAAGILAALNYASESRPVTIPEIESISPPAPASASGPASSSAAASEPVVATATAADASSTGPSISATTLFSAAALEPEVAANSAADASTAGASTGPSVSDAVSSSSAPLITSLLSLPYFATSVSESSVPASFPAIVSSERGAVVVSSSAPAPASVSTPVAGFSFDSSASSMLDSPVVASSSVASIPVRYRARARARARAPTISPSHPSTNVPLPTTTPTPQLITSSASASAPVPLQHINPFYRPRQRSFSFYDASTSEDASLPQNRHLVQSQIHGGIGSSRYVAAIRDAALGVSSGEDSDSEKVSGDEDSEDETDRRRLRARVSEREGEGGGVSVSRGPLFVSRARTTPTGAAVVAFTASSFSPSPSPAGVLAEASAAAEAAVAASAASASTSVALSSPPQIQVRASTGAHTSSSYPFRAEDLNAAYRRASAGAGFNESIDSHVHSYVPGGGESPVKGILKRRYATPSKSPSSREKRVSFIEGCRVGDDEVDVFGNDNEHLPRDVVEFVGRLVEEEDEGEGEGEGGVPVTVTTTPDASAVDPTVSSSEDCGDDVPAKSKDGVN
ncbi:uncharacterized protein KD926_011347 [Aspergillus affinis]|uniref:uncharacterized protein n=1 Tax=Aspergillus affinis TaxID=1070780 RepID=UPI0022FE3870|nr:uncharacterized protein KD926_011347 [Aspergillus affinis]KAI9038009.1 hypothetical protein KD926_011347 [Aspergillus affinis]